MNTTAEPQAQRFTSRIPSLTDIGANRSTSSRFLHNIKVFFTDAWLDVLTLCIIGALTGVVWIAPHAFTRYFPVTFFDGSGDIVYPELSYPYVKPIFSSAGAALVASLIPLAIILLSQLWVRSFFDAANGILGLAYALVTGTFFQVVLKKTIGGLRPHFLSVCKPIVPPGLTGTGFGGIMFTVDQVCTGDRARINNAIESFPSGHAQIAFAGLGYLALYLFAHLRIQGRRRPSHWRMLLVVGPLLLATYLASTLVLGYHHHGYDVIFGGLIGMAMALFGYRMGFLSIFDRKLNNIPSRRGATKDDELDGNESSQEIFRPGEV